MWQAGNLHICYSAIKGPPPMKLVFLTLFALSSRKQNFPFGSTLRQTCTSSLSSSSWDSLTGSHRGWLNYFNIGTSHCAAYSRAVLKFEMRVQGSTAPWLKIHVCSERTKTTRNWHKDRSIFVDRVINKHVYSLLLHLANTIETHREARSDRWLK